MASYTILYTVTQSMVELKRSKPPIALMIVDVSPLLSQPTLKEEPLWKTKTLFKLFWLVNLQNMIPYDMTNKKFSKYSLRIVSLEPVFE